VLRCSHLVFRCIATISILASFSLHRAALELLSGNYCVCSVADADQCKGGNWKARSAALTSGTMATHYLATQSTDALLKRGGFSNGRNHCIRAALLPPAALVDDFCGGARFLTADGEGMAITAAVAAMMEVRPRGHAGTQRFSSEKCLCCQRQTTSEVQFRIK
jgi:hypothetical protein